MAYVTKSIPTIRTGSQQIPRVKNWEQTSLNIIRMPNCKNFLKMHSATMHGLVYEEILKTRNAGCGLVDHALLLFSGLLGNQSIRISRIVGEYICRQGNGMTWLARTLLNIFVKSMVRTTAFTPTIIVNSIGKATTFYLVFFFSFFPCSSGPMLYKSKVSVGVIDQFRYIKIQTWFRVVQSSQERYDLLAVLGYSITM